MSIITRRVALWLLLFATILLPDDLLANGKLLFRTRDPALGYFFEVRDDPKEGGDQLFITKGRAATSTTPIFTSPVNISAAFLSPDKRFLIVTHHSGAYGQVSDVFRFNEEDGSIKPHLPETDFRALLWKTLLRKHPDFAEGFPMHTYAGIRAVIGNKAYLRMRGDYIIDEGPRSGQHYYDPVNITIDLDTLTTEFISDEKLPKYWPRGTPNDAAQSYGSGFWISSRCVLTNQHVVGSAKTVIVATEDKECVANVIAIDDANDLALLEVLENSLTGTPLSFRKQEVPLGLGVRAYGFPLPEFQGFSVKLTAGTISGLYGMNDDPTSLQMTAALQPGNSGGPVVDETGAVVGVSVATLDKLKMAKIGVIPENTNFCIHRDVAVDFIRRHRPDIALPSATTGPNENVHSSVVQIVTPKEEKPPTTTPAPAPPPPVAASTPTTVGNQSSDAMELAMLSFASSFITSGNGGTAEQEASYYADRCDYFDNGSQTKAQILADIKKYRSRWPQRTYTVTNLHGFEKGKAPGKAAVIVDFKYAVANATKQTSGTGSSLIVCENVPDQPRIIFIRTAVNKKKK